MLVPGKMGMRVFEKNKEKTNSAVRSEDLIETHFFSSCVQYFERVLRV